MAKATKKQIRPAAKPAKTKVSKPTPKPAPKASKPAPKAAAPVTKTAPQLAQQRRPASKSKVTDSPKPGSTMSKTNLRDGKSRPVSQPIKLEERPASSSVLAASAGPNSGKKIRNLAGLSTKEVNYFRDQLIQKRREILGDVHSMESEALLNGPGAGNLSNLPDHMADQGTDNYEQEFTLGLMEKDRQLLREIDAALAKVQAGSFGLCEGTAKPISKARLEAQPWARYSIEYARKLEGSFRG